MLYWGGADGFRADRRWEVEAVGVSGLNLRDPGNSYDRGLYEDYLSSAFPVPEGEQPVTIAWNADTPHNTSVVFQIRLADTREDLDRAPWIGASEQGSWFTQNPSALPKLKGRWIQYRARLRTPNAGPTPYLTEVSITFE